MKNKEFGIGGRHRKRGWNSARIEV